MPYLVSLGEVLIDLVSTRNNVSLYAAPAFEPKPGGAPANVAVGVCRLGRSVAFIGKVGRDEFGAGLLSMFKREGVETRGIREDPSLLTTLAFVSLGNRGDPHFAFATGAALDLNPDELDRDLIRGARIFHFSSITLSREPARAATLAAFAWARANNVICSYDVNFRPFLWTDEPRSLDIVTRPFATVDILKMNAEELRLVTSIADPRAALLQLETRAALVVVTQGASGCLYRFDGQIFQADAPPVKKVVDTTGAGDAFMAALLAGIEYPFAADALARLARRACAAGAFATRTRGAIPSLPYPRDLEKFPL